MRYAEIAVDAPVGHSRTFSYSIPSHLSPVPGQLVWVPFGRRIAQGVVMEMTAASRVAAELTKDILQPVEPAPLVGEAQLALARWTSGYYLCSLFSAVALFLPPGFESQVRSRLYRSPGNVPVEAGQENAHQMEVAACLEKLAESPGMIEADFVKMLGRSGERTLRRLLEKGEVRREAELPYPRLKPQYTRYLVAGADEGNDAAIDGQSRLSDKQSRLLATVREAREPYPATLANKEFGGGVANALVRRGLLGQEWVRVGPVPVSQSPFGKGGQGEVGGSVPPELTAEQADALGRIVDALESPQPPFGKGEYRRDSLHRGGYRGGSGSFLLHGVTGSGKTEVYLRAIGRAVAAGRQAVYLVPEISLTPQTVERVSGRFPGRVAVLHSRLTDRQKFDQWWKVRDGEYDVVVGPRSALFAPLPRLGLIVIDEEHEWTYKQEEAEPLYHARTVALEYARRTGAVVVMGSATPDVETYHRARRGQHRLLELPHRIGAGIPPTPLWERGEQGEYPSQRVRKKPDLGREGAETGQTPDLKGRVETTYRLSRESGSALSAHMDSRFRGNDGLGLNLPFKHPPRAGLARVEVCDMRLELREGNRGIFSRGLSAALQDCVGRGRQAVLFLNRRGSASIVQCRGCGYVVSCRRCSAPMAYHSVDGRLRCHSCNRSRRSPDSCRECGGRQIRRLGVGTQRVVAEVEELLPGVQVERWDSDATRSGADHEETMARFASGETQVLVGTQMVAKGLDVPNVGVAGVVLADIGLHVPDFRSSERTFGLLCQLAGRAGRGGLPGEVYIQTYTPEHYAIATAARQDYEALYEREIRSRRELGNPPFNELVHAVFLHTNATACQRQATNTARMLRGKAYSEGLTDVELIGPAPGIPSRLRGRYRWHVALRGRNLHRFLEGVTFPLGSIVDVDPAHVL